ncbi:MAG: PQQ-binding-like beta-propeller repeat protein [Phycisphaeraceae bacterium]|nr:PQQ-binding-like beta-propeller repeat protein [Phycisphaeraceae bacterium]
MSRWTNTAWILSLILAASAPADSWPQFRGPNGDGHAEAENLPIRWDQNTHVAWKIDVPGEGWSSPVLHDGKLYLTAAVREQNGKGRHLSALCYDAETGNRLWAKVVFGQKSKSPRIHKKNSHASPTPIVDGGRLYVHFGHMGTAALDLSGKILWTNNRLRYPPVHGNGGSPVLVGGLLVFSCDGAKNPFVVALDSRTGKVAWRVNRATNPKRSFSFCTPKVITVNGQKQVVLPGSDAVFAYEPKTGKVIWRFNYPGGYSVVPRPVHAHGLVFVSSGFDRAVLYAIDPTGKGDLTKTGLKWKLAKGAPHTPSPLVVGDEIYLVADRGIMTCADAKTGRVHWQKRLGGGGYSASPVHADGRIYVQSESGLGVVVEASTTFRVLSKNDLNERVLASYAVGDGALFIRSEQSLRRIQKP